MPAQKDFAYFTSSFQTFHPFKLIKFWNHFTSPLMNSHNVSVLAVKACSTLSTNTSSDFLKQNWYIFMYRSIYTGASQACSGKHFKQECQQSPNGYINCSVLVNQPSWWHAGCHGNNADSMLGSIRALDSDQCMWTFAPPWWLSS